MNLRITVLFLCLTIQLPAQSQSGTGVNQTDMSGRKQGKWVKTYPNGNIMYEGFFRDNNPEGEFTRYYEDNVLKSRLLFTKDGTEATAALFYPNGFLASQGKYINQLKEGRWKFFSPTKKGLLISEEEYSGDKRNGVSIKYYPDSTIAEKIYYINDIKNGEWTKYYPDGTLTFRTNCRNGKLNGKFEAFYENGKKEFTGQYMEDLREGEWIIFDSSGHQKFKTTYHAGIPDNIDMVIYQSEYLDSIENVKVRFEDPEKTGKPW